jgi:alpha-1,3-mannosyltransferase
VLTGSSFDHRTFYRYEELVEYFNGPDPPPGQSKTVPQLLPYDEADRIRMDEHLPLQVFSCWNGATVIDAAAFLHPHNIRFRTAKNDVDEHGKAKEVTEKASECFLTSVDLWKANMGKILVVPKARHAATFSPSCELVAESGWCRYVVQCGVWLG